jgi:hypothetical protein
VNELALIQVMLLKIYYLNSEIIKGDLMSKILYLITFLSVVLLKSETSFSQELKKELGICGKTMGAILEVTPTKVSQLTTVMLKNDEFCDNGRYEQSANFVISLYNAKKELVYDKLVYLNLSNFSEDVDLKNGSFKKTKIKKDSETSRIVKFPITKEMGEVSFYRIKSLENKTEPEMKTIKWSL